MNIAIVHYAEELPTDPGFVSSRYASLAKVLVARGHEPVRIAPTFSHRRKAMRDRQGTVHSEPWGAIHLVETPGYRSHRSLARLRHLRTFARGAAQVAARLRPDVILSGCPPAGLAAALARGRNGRRPTIIVDVRDLWPDAQRATSRGLTRFGLRAVTPLIRKQVARDANSVDGIVGISQHYATWLERHRTIAEQVPTAIVPLGTRPPPHATEDETNERRGVIFAGSLTHHFAFDALLGAWAILERRRPDLAALHPLTLLGDGAARRDIHERAASLSHVRIVGRIPHADAFEAMERAALAVAPYQSDAAMGLPNKLFEYLSARLPIVSTLRGEMAQFLGQHDLGTTVDEGDLQGYAHAMISWLDDSERRTLAGHHGHDLTQRDYNHDVLGARLADFLLAVHEQRASIRG